MKVLVACEFSGIVREAFRNRGHDAKSCDLIPSLDNSPHHIIGDALWFAENDEYWDLVVAHPPCTYLTNAGVRHLHESVTSCNGSVAACYGTDRFHEMRKAAQFFYMLLTVSAPRVCVENPIPHRYAREIIGKYDQIIQPWQFGHGEVKATCLWLRNLPKLIPTHIVDGRYARCHLESPGIKNGLTRQQRRSITYQGIADAMAEQWGSL